MWVQLVLLVLSAVVSAMLAPKPPAPKKAALGDFQVPTAEQDRVIPVVFGKVRIKGPNVVWYGDLSTIPIKGGGKK